MGTVNKQGDTTVVMVSLSNHDNNKTELTMYKISFKF